MQTNEERAAFAKTLKIALATSIIRNKPKDVSARDYASQLASKLKSAESSWKTKYQQLAKDYEKMQHEVVLLKLKTKENEPPLSTHNSNMQQDEQKVDVVESNTKLLKISDDFLTSVLSFNNWYSKLKSDECGLKILRTSFIEKLKALEESFSVVSLDKHNSKLVEKSQLGEMLRRETFNEDAEIRNICGNIVRSMLAKLMNQSFRQDSEVKDHITSYLVMFGTTCSNFRDMTLDILVCVLTGFTTLLKDLPSFTKLNVTKYENVSYVCKALKEIIITTCPKWSCNKLEKLVASLDDGLFDISGRFLMYTHTIWTISSLMLDAKYQKP